MSVFWEKGRRELEEFCRACRLPSLDGASPFNWYIQPQPPQLLRVTVAVAFRRAVLKHVYTLLRGKDLETGGSSPERREAQFARLASGAGARARPDQLARVPSVPGAGRVPRQAR